MILFRNPSRDPPRTPTRSSPMPRTRNLAKTAAVALGLAVCLTAVGFTPLQDKTAPFPRQGKYVGKADCTECHEDEAERIGGGYHSKVVNSAWLRGCETCHGPGKTHADDEDNATKLISFPPKLSRQVQQKLCGQCHADQMRYHGGDLEGFFAAGKTCTDCHKVHTLIKPQPHSGVLFRSRAEATQKATPVGAKKCITCHPLRNQLLQHGGHKLLMADQDGTGCETCHGPGSLHVETGGLARLITRPDQAGDGLRTCRSCHENVDPIEFHWKGEKKPLLSNGMTCTTCHTVHRDPKVLATSPRGPSTAAVNIAAAQDAPTNDTCAKCHEPAFGVLRNTIHQDLGERGIPLHQGCGGCHAGGAEHARSGGKRDLVESLHGSDAATQMKTCAQCHDKDRALRHAKSGAHHRNEVTCLTCHSPAAPKNRVREDAAQKCATCHQKVASEFKQPNHHPVPEGRMSCVDCHEPHSARTRIRDRRLRHDNCVKCHKQYRGPFVFNHQASRTDGCVVCHSPHGSTNRRMLEQHTSQQNCLQCHGDFPSFHDQTKGAVFTNCLSCHTEVHGSNHSRYLFR